MLVFATFKHKYGNFRKKEVLEELLSSGRCQSQGILGAREAQPWPIAGLGQGSLGVIVVLCLIFKLLNTEVILLLSSSFVPAANNERQKKLIKRDV